MPRLRDHLLTTVDLVDTFILALEFAVAAVHADLDLFGILVLATVGATGGGIMRDLLLVVHPPAALRDWRYVTIAIAAASTTIVIGTWRGAIGGWTGADSRRSSLKPERRISIVEHRKLPGS